MFRGACSRRAAGEPLHDGCMHPSDGISTAAPPSPLLRPNTHAVTLALSRERWRMCKTVGALRKFATDLPVLSCAAVPIMLHRPGGGEPPPALLLFLNRMIRLSVPHIVVGPMPPQTGTAVACAAQSHHCARQRRLLVWGALPEWQQPYCFHGARGVCACMFV